MADLLNYISGNCIYTINKKGLKPSSMTIRSLNAFQGLRSCGPATKGGPHFALRTHGTPQRTGFVKPALIVTAVRFSFRIVGDSNASERWFRIAIYLKVMEWSAL